MDAAWEAGRGSVCERGRLSGRCSQVLRVLEGGGELEEERMGARRKQRLLGADVGHLVHTHQLALAKNLQGIGPLGRLVNDELHPARGQSRRSKGHMGDQGHMGRSRGVWIRHRIHSCASDSRMGQGWVRDGSGMDQGWVRDGRGEGRRGLTFRTSRHRSCVSLPGAPFAPYRGSRGSSGASRARGRGSA
jgi:hypothetical protein